jgi:hypothetical protein
MSALRAQVADSSTAAACSRPRPTRKRHTPGGQRLGQDASREAQQLAAAILEVLAGARTPGQAAESLGLSLPRYFQLETRAMQALLAGCEARPHGRQPSVSKELAVLQRQHERLQRELTRQQSLVRIAQRSIGLPPPTPPPKPAPGKKKKRRPVVRALHAAGQLQRQSQETPPPSAPAELTENKM